MVIDAHCHAGLGDGLTGPWDTRASLGRYLRRAREAGIDRTVVFPAFHSDYAEANRLLAALVARRPDRLIGFAMVHGARDRGRVGRMLATAVSCWGFRGIKVHRHDAPITREICAAARRLGVPVLYDVTGDIPHLGLVAREYPDVPFIAPHLGSFSDDWRAHETLIDLMARRPNVFTDTSGVRRFDYLAEAVRRLSARRVIFGSDGPELHPGLELAKIRFLGLPCADEADILGGNISRLLTRPGRSMRRRPAWRELLGATG
jgi:hypothetical protein